MAKTLVDFRAEQGLYLKDLAAILEMDEEELRAVEESGTVPAEIGQRLILHYALPENYFLSSVYNDKGSTPENPTKYFIKITIIYYLLSALASSVPMFASYIELFVGIFNPESNFSIIDNPIYTAFSSIWSIAVSILGCILFADYLLKNTTFTGDIKKYQFLHYSIPSGMIAFISMVTAFITTHTFDPVTGVNETYFLWQGFNFIVSLISMALVVAIHVKLLNTAIEEENAKKQKTLKTFAIIVTVSSVLAFVLTIISQILLQDFRILVIIRRIFVYGLYIAVSWAVALVNPDDENKCKIAYTILPLVSICHSIIFTIIGLFI
ncbi:MAG: hypothetical protein IKW45_07935 [Clostridia bacterium]|nr:hypothetical protein [Clostridia bacterium]